MGDGPSDDRVSLVEDLLAVARIPAPTFAEQERAAWVADRLEGAPGSIEPDAVGNLVWRADRDPVSLLLLVHLDTVFPAGTELVFERGGDSITGPGIGDNAAAVAVAVNLISTLAGSPTPGLAVAFTVGEEGLGNLRGAAHACAELSPRVAVALEGHGLDDVFLRAVGSVRARVATSGPGGHSWWDRGTPSATHALISLLADLLAGHEGSPLNIGTIEGGSGVNAVAERAEALVELRALEAEPLERFRAEIESLAVPGTVTVELLGARPSGAIPADHFLTTAVLDVRRRLGLPLSLADGSTDANAALGLGIPALALGCARGSGMHSRAETIVPSSLELGLRQCRLVVEALTQRPR